jgi:hypothetical protein
MVEINWTDEVEKWLKDIHDYIALDNSLAAKRVIKGIYDKAQILDINLSSPKLSLYITVLKLWLKKTKNSHLRFA